MDYKTMDDRPETVGEALETARRVLRLHSETAALDAQVLLAHILAKPRTWVLIRPEARLTPSQQDALGAALARLREGTPLPYVLGAWEFYGRSFEVGPEALIPRPETEHLVEAALDWLRARPGVRLAADAGTGTGCIAVTLAAERPSLRLVAADISPAALHLARRNARRHNVASRLDFLRADLLTAFAPRSLPLICANLPYIPTGTLRRLDVYGREPTLALDGGADGLELIRRLLAQAETRLALGGLLLLEIAASQGESAPRAARKVFPRARIDLLPDLAGHPRLLRIQT